MKNFLLILGWFGSLWFLFYLNSLFNIKSYYFYGETEPWYFIPYIITSYLLMIGYAIFIIGTILKEEEKNNEKE